MMKFRTKLLTSLMVLGLKSFSTYAQIGMEIQLSNNDVNLNGRITGIKNNSNYLSRNWNKGAVMLANDTIYRNLELIFDMANNRPIFKAPDGRVQMFRSPVKEFSINFSDDDIKGIKKFKNGFPSISANNNESFYEILSEGNATLLKHTQIKIVDERPVGSIYSVKQNKQVPAYYIFSKNKMTPFSRDKKQLLLIFNQEKRQLVVDYIDKEKTNFKNDNELSALFDYYNNL